MHKLRTSVLALMLFVTIAAPALAYAATGISFGGKVVSILPCLSPLGPSLQVTIVPAGAFPVAYIWTPATVTLQAGLPTHPGQQILGIADIPFACVIPSPFFFIPALTLFGLRMQAIGTSLI
jgi:hypothetical protein